MKKKIVTIIALIILIQITSFAGSNQITTQNNQNNKIEYKNISINITDNLNKETIISSGESISYEINFYNPNDQSINHVIIKDTIPEEVIFEEASEGFNQKDNWIKWYYPRILAGEQKTLWLNVTVKENISGFKKINNTVTIKSSNTSENKDYEHTFIGELKPLKIEINSSNNGLNIFDSTEYINYTILCENQNTVIVENVWINIQMNENLKVENISDKYFVDYDDKWLSWFVSSIKPDANITLTINVSINETTNDETWIINHGFVSATDTAEKNFETTPQMYNFNEKIFYVQKMKTGWNLIDFSDIKTPDLNLSIENIFSSILENTEIIFENQTNNNYVVGEGANNLSNINPDEEYLVKMKTDDFFFLSESNKEINHQPIANAGGPYNGKTNQSINFDGSQSDDSDSDELEYRWSFNDSNIFTEWSKKSWINYSFNQEGTYNITLEVTDGEFKDSDTTKAVIKNKIENLSGFINGPKNGFPDEKLFFNVTINGGVEPYNISWDLDNDNSYNDGYSDSTYYTWINSGSYTIYSKVKDNIDNIIEFEHQINIQTGNNPPDKPTINGGPIGNGVTGKEYEFTFTSTDPDGEQIKFTVEWGDGETDNSDFVDSGSEFTVSHKWSGIGSKTIRVFVTDESDSMSKEETFKVTIVPDSSGSEDVLGNSSKKKDDEDEAGFPWLWVIILIIVIGAVLGFWFLTKKKDINILSLAGSKTVSSTTESWSEEDTWDETVESEEDDFDESFDGDDDDDTWD